MKASFLALLLATCLVQYSLGGGHFEDTVEPTKLKSSSSEKHGLGQTSSSSSSSASSDKVIQGGYNAAPKPPVRDQGYGAPKPLPTPPPHDQDYGAPKSLPPPPPPPRDQGYGAPRPHPPPPPPPRDQGGYNNAPVSPPRIKTPPLPTKGGFNAPKPILLPTPPRDQGGYNAPKTPVIPPRRDQPNGYSAPKPLPPRDQPTPSPVPTIPPRPMPPRPNGYNAPPKPITPPRDQPTGYNAKPKPIIPLPPRDQSGGYGNAPPPMIPPHMPPSDVPTPSLECATSDHWADVVGCYECEIKKCVSTCQGQLEPSFDLCYNETALFKLRALFTECLRDDHSTCHKLNEDMALAFLISNYDSELADLRRRDECLFKCSLPNVMKCMDPCQPFAKTDDVDNEPIVVCYNHLRHKISKMLHGFSHCIKRHDNVH